MRRKEKHRRNRTEGAHRRRTERRRFRNIDQNPRS